MLIAQEAEALAALEVALPPDSPPPPPAPPAPATPRVLTPRTLTVDRSSTPPGARVSTAGGGCDPGAGVSLEIGARPVATGVADPVGAFSITADVPSLPVGRHDVVARCGPVLATTLDVVLVSQIDPGTTTLVVLVFFVLLSLAVIRRQLTGRT